MKQLFYFCFAMVFALSCSSDEKPIVNDLPIEEVIPPIDLDLTEILERGYINAAVDYSSTTYFVYRGEIMGFEYEILKMLEEYFKIKVNIIVLPSIEAAITRLNKGEVDIIAYPLTITKERKKIIAFTTHYSSKSLKLRRVPDRRCISSILDRRRYRVR